MARRNLKIIAASYSFLESLSSAGIDLSILPDRSKVESILSEVDFKKYKEQIEFFGGENPELLKSGFRRNSSTDNPYVIEMGASCAYSSIDSIAGVWRKPSYYESHLKDTGYDVSILDENYEGKILTYPVFYKQDVLSNVYVYLVQVGDSRRDQFVKGWYEFYKTLHTSGYSAKDLSVNTTFNYYINMTTGVTFSDAE